MKKKLILALSIMSLVLLSGCGLESNISINDKNKTITCDSSLYYNEEEYVSIKESSDFNESDYSKVEVNGKTYYKQTSEKETQSWDEFNKEYERELISKNSLILPVGTSLETLDISYDFIDITVDVPFNIEYTNGDIIGDNKIRFTDKDKASLFISSDKSVKNGNNLDFRNYNSNKIIKNKSILNTSDLYNSKKQEVSSILITSSDSFIDTAYITRDKKKTSFNPYSHIPFTLSTSISTINDKTTVDATNGKYTITAELISGVKKSCVYYIDTKAPTITVKNNKINCIDKKKDGYASGIKTIKVNNKTVKNGSKVNKGDIVTVIDKAGNTTKKKVK